MTIEFMLLVNKQGQTRLAHYTKFLPIEERSAMEGEIVRKCLQRRETECNFLEHLHYKIVYRRYASLFVIVGIDGSRATSTAAPETGNDTFYTCAGDGDGNAMQEGELAVFEFIHLVVETFDKYFGDVCELDVMFNLEKAHFILEEMIANEGVCETNKLLVLQPIVLMDEEPRKV
ncbi:putative clathrin assembly sigma-adaptin protein complex 4 [Trypanosoma vivax]|nr:putative clathrin assembly sigma-adaptin protein complex 4 [Trypanosoma vivax]